ncbi:transglutaminase [Methylocystis bryophila]|uniref:Transglutaminase n=2 Tax=Methylocystis bryophila TaxID=655015 RepID=A0A1W6N199_9HYPH|nr:transglutaminase [Methylocystis bryophila]
MVERFGDAQLSKKTRAAAAALLKVALLPLFGVLALSLQIEPLHAAAYRASFAPVGEEASIPYGWMDFCTRQPQECNQPVLPPQDVALTAKTWKLLEKINAEVNASIEPISNLDHWGTLADHWDYPIDGKGDCKIYALEKRRQLIERGVPRQALLMTIVKDHHNMGHTILTVRTDKGDFILDNLTDEILSWDETGYHFLKRQSQEDPNVWLAILSPASGRKISAR